MKDEACFRTLHTCLSVSMPGDEISLGNTSDGGEDISPALSPGYCSREGGVSRSPKWNWFGRLLVELRCQGSLLRSPMMLPMEEEEDDAESPYSSASGSGWLPCGDFSARHPVCAYSHPFMRLHHTSPKELVWGWQRIWSLKFREFMIINCTAECKMMFQEVPSSLDPGGHWRPESRFNLTSTRVSLSEGRYDTTMGGEGTTPSCCSFEILQNCWGTGQNQRNRRVQPEVKTFEVLSNIRSPKKIDFLY